MLFAYLSFVLLCIGITLLLSPVVIRYTKGESACLTVHFVFGSVRIFKKSEKNEAEKNSRTKKKEKKRTRNSAPMRALRHVIPRSVVHIGSLPFPTVLSPTLMGVGIGAYYSLLSIVLAKFKYCTSDPLLAIKKEDAPALDIRFRVRLYTFLHTFLIYLVHYRKEKEAKRVYVGNKNE